MEKRNKEIETIIKSYEISEKGFGIFIYGDQRINTLIMRRLGYASDVRKIGGIGAQRGFWVKKIKLNPDNEMFQDLYKKAIIKLESFYPKKEKKITYKTKFKERKTKQKKQKISFELKPLQSINLNPDGTRKINNQERQFIEEDILKEIQIADIFEGILVTSDDINYFFRRFNIGYITMRKIISALGFKDYHSGIINGFWIKEHPGFKNRIIIPENYMQDKIDEYKTYNRHYILCPKCKGLCTPKYKCYTCYGHKVIKESAL